MSGKRARTSCIEGVSLGFLYWDLALHFKQTLSLTSWHKGIFLKILNFKMFFNIFLWGGQDEKSMNKGITLNLMVGLLLTNLPIPMANTSFFLRRGSRNPLYLLLLLQLRLRMLFLGVVAPAGAGEGWQGRAALDPLFIVLNRSWRRGPSRTVECPHPRTFSFLGTDDLQAKILIYVSLHELSQSRTLSKDFKEVVTAISLCYLNIFFWGD